MMLHPINKHYSISQEFSPPIFCVQLLFERISSPWESNFEGIKSIFVRFLPFSTPSNFSSSYSQRQISIGSGHLFFIRGTNQSEEPGWIDLEAKSGGNNEKIWKGQIQLINEKKNEKIYPLICPLNCQQQNGLKLEAHFLLSIVEIQKRIENNKIEKIVQTDLIKKKLLIERGTQTNKEEEKRLLSTVQQQQNNTQRLKDKRLIRLLLFLLLKTKNETKDFEQKNQKHSKATLTECSLPPYNKLTTNNRIKNEQFRAQIGYLSSVHKTFVTNKDKKEIAQKRRNNLDKVFNNKKLLKIEEEKIRSPRETKFLNFEVKNKNFNNSPLSSGLQSIALSDENETNIKIGKKNNERIDELDKFIRLNEGIKKNSGNVLSTTKKQSSSSSSSISQKIQKREENENIEYNTKASSSSSTGYKEAVKTSIISSISKSSISNKTQKSTERSTDNDDVTTENENSEQSNKSSTTKTTTKSSTITSKKSSSISGGVGSSSVQTDSSVPVEIIAENFDGSSQISGSTIESDKTLKNESQSTTSKEFLTTQVLRDL